ncbi:unnamed protein product [Arctia plantaginis]|uniref:Plasminogen activator inhibitor 1 n=1 Tax=Arctia plantaginis TaxID=874455 RepID=A0A8S1AFM3_ARCPL|nr:unnamed protein product [Arctia plantaginis]
MYKSLLTFTVMANLFSSPHGRIKDKNTIMKTLVDAVSARYQAGGDITNKIGPSHVIAKIIEKQIYSDKRSNNSTTSCKGDPNATPGCDKTCIKRCPGNKPNKCTCPTDSCECKEGYVYNPNTFKCTKSDECGDKISKDESTTSCKEDPNAMPGCDKRCIKRCPGNKPNKCTCPTDSCECKEGYVYNPNTFKCTKSDECGDKMSKNSTTSCKGDPNIMPGCNKKCLKRYPGTKSSKKSANRSTPALDSMIQDTCETESLELYLKADLAFTAKILQEITRENYGSNLVVGGSSILYLLGQLQLFALKGAAKQIQKALDLNNEQVACFLPKFYENITKPQYTIEYDAVTTIIADNNCPFTNKFKRRLQKVFHTEPFQYDFSNPLSARMINDMIAMRTNNNIKNFVTSDVLSSLTNLILVDTQSFGGEWQNKFDSKDTTEMEFHGANSRITKKQTMFQSGKFLYTNNLSLGCKVLKINYKSSEFSMVIFLPHFANGVPGLVKKLSSGENVLKALTNLRKVNVDIYLPRFKVSSASRLKFPVLKANVNRIFNASSAGLQRVASCTTPFVSDILQKIILTVNENGGGNADDDNLGM